MEPTEPQTIEEIESHSTVRYVIISENANTSPEIAALQAVYDVPSIYMAWAEKYKDNDANDLIEGDKWKNIYKEYKSMHSLRQKVGNIRQAIEEEENTQIIAMLEDFHQESYRFVQETGITWPPQHDHVTTINATELDILTKADLIGTMYHDIDNKAQLIHMAGGFMESFPEDVNTENMDFILSGVRGVPAEALKGMRLVAEGVTTSKIDTQELRKVVDNDLVLTLRRKVHELAPAAKLNAEEVKFAVVGDPLPSEVRDSVYNMTIFKKLTENVAQNAVKAVFDLSELPEEGVELTTTYEAVDLPNGQRMLEVRFSDNGRGLSDPTVERVDFTEGGTSWNKEETGEVKGTGFGMYSLAETTRKLGGDLFLAPRKDGKRGASVVLQIPLTS